MSRATAKAAPRRPAARVARGPGAGDVGLSDIRPSCFSPACWRAVTTRPTGGTVAKTFRATGGVGKTFRRVVSSSSSTAAEGDRVVTAGRNGHPERLRDGGCHRPEIVAGTPAARGRREGELRCLPRRTVRPSASSRAGSARRCRSSWRCSSAASPWPPPPPAAPPRPPRGARGRADRRGRHRGRPAAGSRWPALRAGGRRRRQGTLLRRLPLGGGARDRGPGDRRPGLPGRGRPGCQLHRRAGGRPGSPPPLPWWASSTRTSTTAAPR